MRRKKKKVWSKVVGINDENCSISGKKRGNKTKESRIERINCRKVSICLASETTDKLSDSSGGIQQKKSDKAYSLQKSAFLKDIAMRLHLAECRPMVRLKLQASNRAWNTLSFSLSEVEDFWRFEFPFAHSFYWKLIIKMYRRADPLWQWSWRQWNVKKLCTTETTEVIEAIPRTSEDQTTWFLKVITTIPQMPWRNKFQRTGKNVIQRRIHVLSVLWLGNCLACDIFCALRM